MAFFRLQKCLFSHMRYCQIDQLAALSTKPFPSDSPFSFKSLSDEHSGVIVGQMLSTHNRNALSYAMIKSLNESLDMIRADYKARVVIFTSGLPGIFCAGADLKERKLMANDEVLNFVSGLRGLMTKIAELPIPTIAVLDGVAFGGGLEMALACDLRIAGPSASMGLVETRLGIIPGAGGTQRLSRVVGIAKAKELIFTGAKLSGVEASQIGLVNYTVEDPYAKSIEISKEILKAGPIAIRAAKMAIDQGFEVNVNSGMAFEQQGYAQVLWTKDRAEGMKAFVEKRDPVFIGE